MKVAIEYNETEQRVISQLKYLVKEGRYSFTEKKIPGLPLEKIAELYCEAFNINQNELFGKINHNKSEDKDRKLTFNSGMYFFSNLDSSEIEDFAQYKGHLFFRSRNHPLAIVKWKWKYAPQIIKFYTALNKACPNRLPRLTKLDFSNIDGVSDWSGLAKLSSYQISKIPLKAIDWFYNNNNQFSILGYDMSKEGQTMLVYSAKVSNDLLLFTMQSQGYRFIKSGDEKLFSKHHPICDRCLQKNNCSNKKIGMFGGSFDDTKSNFTCFEDLPTEILKVDLHLLYPLKSYQLQ